MTIANACATGWRPTSGSRGAVQPNDQNVSSLFSGPAGFDELGGKPGLLVAVLTDLLVRIRARLRQIGMTFGADRGAVLALDERIERLGPLGAPGPGRHGKYRTVIETGAAAAEAKHVT